ncbi:MAG: ROK family protein [Hamadaea sp.]|nr:ROK family protein [Hamadaea sp.]NUR51652.1 ROK family protein [Hamadaea sp.]NUT07876.1 ROK family protein [Hamadaea sp.]
MVARRATVRDMRRSNRAVLLSKIYLDGPLSRHELTQLTSLSPASVSTLVAEFLEEGLVEEAGSVESDGGRPRVLLRVAPSFGHVIGVDVGETRVTVELFDMSMAALAKADYPIEPNQLEPSVTVAHILEGITAVCAQAGVDQSTVLGVGVAFPGVVDSGEEGLVHAQHLGWADGVPIGTMLRAGTQIPVHIDNGAKTLGQAEMWFGAGRGTQHAVIALVGSGVGAAVVADGASYRGSRSSAGEWGHTTLVYGGRRCRCGALGCLEAYVGAEGILDRYRDANGQGAPGIDEESAIGSLIAAADSSPTAREVLTQTVGYLGAGIATLINLFNPERIVLGGWAGTALGGRWLPEIRAAAAEHALKLPFAQTTITLCELGPDAVALGAATLPVARLLADGGLRPAAAAQSALVRGPRVRRS